MKHFPLAIIFVIASAAAAPMKHVLLNQVRGQLLFPNQYKDSRELQFSDECVSDNQAIAESPIFTSLALNAANACPEATTVTEKSLTMDYSDCPSWTDGVKEACDAVNGKFMSNHFIKH